MKFYSLDLALLSLLILFSQVIITILFRKREKFLIIVIFVLSAISSFLAVIAGVWAVASGVTVTNVLLLGVPDLLFHLRIDSLSGFFLTTIGLLSFYISIYSIGYVKGYIGHRPIARLIIFYSLFLAGMFMVVLADDALFFMIAWELMAASSYFLVLYEDEKHQNKRAALLYLVIAHIGAIAILLSFGIMAGWAGDLTYFNSYNFDAMRLANFPMAEWGGDFSYFSGYTFDAMRAAKFPVGWATAAFLLAFFGFSAKAGVIPLHVWLPEAHPVAPSNISALMSGVMLKTAIYGIIRVAFDFIKVFPWWWGVLVLVFGILSAVLGIIYAFMQHDIKRLLAYSSVENIGIILIGLGLSMIFLSFKLPILAALALMASLYHVLNHALFKGLLFMGAGAVIQATKERNMNNMGGLIKTMPWTAFLFLIGCVSISALPPFNGFVSEWLIFQAFLLSPSLTVPLVRLMLPVGASLLALTGALVAATFVKTFGVAFLGKWRGTTQQKIKEASHSMILAMSLAAFSCLLLGIFPSYFLHWLGNIPEQLFFANINTSLAENSWLWLTPINAHRASYSGFIVFVGIMFIIILTFLIFHVKKNNLKRVETWDCGFGGLTNRMQYSATAFEQPLRKIFGGIFQIRERVGLNYFLRIRDRVWMLMYQPIINISYWLSRQVGRLQQGRVNDYLIYSFVTILFLLTFLR